MPADLAIVNAAVHTVDPAVPRAEAVAVADGRIAAVGENATFASSSAAPR